MRLLLFSGGLDSSALAWKFRPDLALTVDYGQRPAAGEVRAAAGLCDLMGLKHEVLRVDLGFLGTGTLSGKDTASIAAAPEWWPYRNQMLVTLAGMAFVPRGLSEIMIGAVGTDVHADGQEPFLTAMDRVMALQEGGVRLSAPAMKTNPLELLRESGFPLEFIGATFSCHLAEYPCGQCRGCDKHLSTLSQLSRGHVG